MRTSMAGILVLGITVAQTAFAVDSTVGLRFDADAANEPHEMSILNGETATLELFVSTVEGTAWMEGLDFSSDQDSHEGWDYSLSRLTGPLTDRFSAAFSPDGAHDQLGPFTELVVDPILITPQFHEPVGTYTIAPAAEFDVIRGCVVLGAVAAGIPAYRVHVSNQRMVALLRQEAMDDALLAAIQRAELLQASPSAQSEKRARPTLRDARQSAA